MTQTPTKRLTFEEYLAYDDGTENRYELVNGDLVLINPPTVRHSLITDFIHDVFKVEIKRLGLPWVSLREAGMRTSFKKATLPDVCVLTSVQVRELMDEFAVFEFPAVIAVEVVSPESVKRDYRYKRSEYAVLGIPEYWIVDPLEAKVTVLLLVEGLYEDTEFRGNQQIISQSFPELTLTVEQVLSVV